MGAGNEFAMQSPRPPASKWLAVTQHGLLQGGWQIGEAYEVYVEGQVRFVEVFACVGHGQIIDGSIAEDGQIHVRPRLGPSAGT